MWPIHRRTALQAAFLLTSTVVVGACAHHAKNPFDGPQSAGSSLYVDVDNGLFYDVGVYAVRQGSRVRIGTVSSHSQGTLKVSESIVGTGRDFRLEADLVGSQERYLTQQLIISQGDRVNWTIVNGLYSSQATVR